ncbi:MAG: hypothetical protein ABR903_06435 [Thermodesulfovibrionales bacterium]|jgi:threonine synthase
MDWRGVSEEYGEFLPVSDKTPKVVLQEGSTPLIRASNLLRKVGIELGIHLKHDGANPTGSFKGRA